MSSPARRVGRWSAALVVAAAVTSVGLQQAAAHARSGSGSEKPDPTLVHEGRLLFLRTCSSCHGTDARGVDHRGSGGERGPGLRGVGAAAAYYQLETGRMPLADSGDQPTNKPSPFTDHQISALVAYVASLGHGPKVPDVTLNRQELPRGGVLYRANCAPCHNAAGAGGALSYGRSAPSLVGVKPRIVGAAVRSGPGQMPRFSPRTITDKDVSAVAAYVHYLKKPENRGGLPLGGLGPVPEGFAIWVLGLGLLLTVTLWISTRVRAYWREDRG